MTTIVGFLADLVGTQGEIRPSTPVVRIDGALAVVGSTNPLSRRHLMPAVEDGPGIHLLPPEAETPFEPLGADEPRTHAQQVMVVGVDLRNALMRLNPDGALTEIVAGWAFIDDDHVAGVRRIGEFAELRREAMLQLRAELLRRLYAGEQATASVFDAFQAVAPREEKDYLVGVAAYYRFTGRTEYDQQIMERAQDLGLSMDDLNLEIAAAITQSTGSVARYPSAQHADVDAQAAAFIAQYRLRADPVAGPSALTFIASRGAAARDAYRELSVSQLEAALNTRGYALTLSTINTEPQQIEPSTRLHPTVWVRPAPSLETIDAEATTDIPPTIDRRAPRHKVQVQVFTVAFKDTSEPDGTEWSFHRSPGLTGAST